MIIKRLYIDSFLTKLGTVDLELQITSIKEDVSISTSENTKLINTSSHSIEVIAFENITEWVNGHLFPIESSKGWVIRIRKITSDQEQLTLCCKLLKVSDKIKAIVDSGEHLDAVWIESDQEVVSIGTEDGEMLKYRAERNDWMPTRFQKELGYQSISEFSFTTYLETGFETQVPALNIGEKLYFHYLVATNARKRSKDYPDHDDISTTFAVDFPKWTIVKRLNLEEE